jgi:TetR/AcrR family transcriptional regulator, lmrAB and yxaGH operons repressor
MSTKRDALVEAAARLFEAQGYAATGLNQILEESGTPKGSLYHYFPEGKEALAAAAIDRAGREVAARITRGLAVDEDAARALRDFVYQIAWGVELSGFRSGGPLTTVATETVASSQRLNLACREAYQRLQSAFTEKLVSSGYTKERAAQLALFINAAIEGGIVLSRTHHSGDPLRQIGDELAQLLRAEPGA